MHDVFYKLPLKCSCEKEMTVLEILVNKDGFKLTLVCASCGSEGFYVARFEKIIATCIELDKAREKGDGHKKGNEEKNPL